MSQPNSNKEKNLISEMKTKKKEFEVREVPGNFCSGLFFEQFREFRKLYFQFDKYVLENKNKYNASVFKADPGRRFFLLTDYTSVEFFINASDSILDRPDGDPIAGGLARTNDEIFRKAEPPLLLSGNRHLNARKFIQSIILYRADAFETALEDALAEMMPKLVSKRDFDFRLNLFVLLANFAFRWLFDIPLDHSLCRDCDTWTSDNVFTPAVDNYLLKTILKIRTKPNKNSIKLRNNVCSIIRTSKHYKYYQELAKQYNQPEEKLADNLIFNALFNVAGAAYKTLWAALPKIKLYPEISSSLRKELGGQKLSLNNVDNYEYLDCVFYELCRLFAGPSNFCKIARQRFLLPSSDKCYYQIRKGDILVASQVFARLDPTVFENPYAFAPTRFQKEPSLKKKVYFFTRTSVSQHEYGCAAEMVSKYPFYLMKKLVAHFIVKYDWEFDQKPIWSMSSPVQIDQVINKPGLKFINFIER